MSRPDDEPVLPDVTRDEQETGWGDETPEDDDVRRLLDERPPHHDRG